MSLVMERDDILKRTIDKVNKLIPSNKINVTVTNSLPRN